MEMSDRENRSVMYGAGTDVQVEKVSRFPQERSSLCWELVPARRRWSRRASTGFLPGDRRVKAMKRSSCCLCCQQWGATADQPSPGVLQVLVFPER